MRRAHDLGMYVVTDYAAVRELGTVPFYFRNELPGADCDDSRSMQICRSAPYVGSTIVSACDRAEVEAFARIARLPPMTDSVRFLLEDDPA